MNIEGPSWFFANRDDIAAFQNDACRGATAQVLEVDDSVDEEIGGGTGRIPAGECATGS